jgi:hypothetical protein
LDREKKKKGKKELLKSIMEEKNLSHQKKGKEARLQRRQY